MPFKAGRWNGVWWTLIGEVDYVLVINRSLEHWNCLEGSRMSFMVYTALIKTFQLTLIRTTDSFTVYTALTCTTDSFDTESHFLRTHNHWSWGQRTPPPNRRASGQPDAVPGTLQYRIHRQQRHKNGFRRCCEACRIRSASWQHLTT
jgi:hypothetical protein